MLGRGRCRPAEGPPSACSALGWRVRSPGTDVHVHLVALLSGTPGLEPGISSLSGFCPGACFPWIALATWETTYRWRPLRTARFRWRVDQTWTRHVPLVGAAALRIADLGWQGDPRRLPPTSDPRLAITLLGGALAGSGPGTSPYVGAIPGQRHGYPSVLPVQTMRTMVGSWTTWHPQGRSLLGVLKLVHGGWGRWDSNPPPYCSSSRGRGREGAATWDSFVPIVTARARPYPQVTDAVRTQHGPAGPHPYQACSRDAFMLLERGVASSLGSWS